jgi:MFS family permease
MSGFWLMFMQLFDMLPNFIVDWVDSSQMVKDLNLPEWMLQYNSTRGPQLAQEWLINANAGFIILAVILVSFLVAKMRRVTSITLGIIVSSVGLMLAGFWTAGYFCLLGILVFSVGEMLASPKMNEYLGVIAPEGKKGLYMGYANIPQAVGWAYGSFLAGQIYDEMGDKANLAIRYLSEKMNVTDVARPEAMDRLVELTGMSHAEATHMLWSAYDPYKLWIPFVAIGVVSAIAMLGYSYWVRKDMGADA